MSDPTNGGERLGRLYQSVEDTRKDVSEVKEMLVDKLFPRVEALERRHARWSGAITAILAIWAVLQAHFAGWLKHP
jgi:hypothetical protein